MKTYIKAFCCIVAIIVTVSVLAICSCRSENDYQYDYLRENYYNYLGAKVSLINEVENYITQVAPTSDLRAYKVVELCEQYNMDVIFVLAQGQVESVFGTKGLARKTNSVWNVGAYDNKPISKKYKYNHPNESIEPYIKLLLSRYLKDRTEVNLLTNFVDINGNRYATNSHYEDMLTDKYNTIKTSTSIDSLQYRMYYYYKRSCN